MEAITLDEDRYKEFKSEVNNILTERHRNFVRLSRENRNKLKKVNKHFT